MITMSYIILQISICNCCGPFPDLQYFGPWSHSLFGRKVAADIGKVQSDRFYIGTRSQFAGMAKFHY